MSVLSLAVWPRSIVARSGGGAPNLVVGETRSAGAAAMMPATGGGGGRVSGSYISIHFIVLFCFIKTNRHFTRYVLDSHHSKIIAYDERIKQNAICNI